MSGPGQSPRDGRAELDALERVFAALAHPSRRRILLVLHARGDRVRAGEIAERFACAWPTTTRHLRALEAAGLVSVEREGRERFYRLETRRLRDVVGGWLDHFGSLAPPDGAEAGAGGGAAARNRASSGASRTPPPPDGAEEEPP